VEDETSLICLLDSGLSYAQPIRANLNSALMSSFYSLWQELRALNGDSFHGITLSPPVA